MTEPKYKINEIVYTIINLNDEESSNLGITAYIAQGRVTGIIQLDENNYKYIITGKTYSLARLDSYVYGTIDELINDFKEVIIQ